MSAPYPAPRPMSATPGAATLRARIAVALADLIAEHGTRHIGEVIGAANSTVHRRGEDIAQWPAADLLTLAVAFPQLGCAVVAYIQGTHPPVVDSTEAERLASRAIADDAGDIARLNSALADGRITRDEAMAIARASGEAVNRHNELISACMARIGRQP